MFRELRGRLVGFGVGVGLRDFVDDRDGFGGLVPVRLADAAGARVRVADGGGTNGADEGDGVEV